MSEKTGVPRSARIFILVVVAGGVAALAIRIPEVLKWSRDDLLAWAALVVANIFIEQFMVQIRHRTETLNIALEEALWVAGLILVAPSVLTMAVAVGTLLGQGIRRWSFYKVAFNIGQFVVAITVAEIIFGALGARGAADAYAWVAAGVAMFGYFVVNVGSVALIISLAEKRSFLSVLLPPLHLNLLHWAGNTAIGILGALLYERAPVGLPLLVVPAVLSYFAYRAWVQGMRERDRMRNLYEAGRALFAPLTAPEDLRPFVSLVGQMLDAPAVEVVIVGDDQVTIHDADGTFSLTPTPTENGERRPPEAYVRVRAGMSSHLAIIGARGETRGILAAYREQPFTASERSLLDTLASQVFVRFENLRLFSETLEQRTQLGDIIAHTSDGIFVVSPERKIMSWNPAMERMTGVPASEAVGSGLDAILGGEDSEGLSKPEDAMKGQVEVRDLPIISRDGGKRWLRYTRNPIQDRDGVLTAYVVVARDITADLETEQLKADFVATVSHELRTPLTPLKGFLSALLQGTVEDSPKAREEYYRIMLNQTSRLERLITDLLEVSRIESGKPVVDSRPIELTSLIAEHIHEYSNEGEGRIVFRAPGDPVLVHADPFRVGQVIANLISNALKYSPAQEPVEVQVVKDGEQAIVSVQDQGEGIPVSEQDRVFDRFHRVESGMTRRTGGTGLGLYIAKRLVEAMAGRLWLVSRPGDGSTFSFTLPLAETGSLFTRAASRTWEGPAAEPENGESAEDGEEAEAPGRPLRLP